VTQRADNKLQKTYFHRIQSLVYDRALALILKECVNQFEYALSSTMLAALGSAQPTESTAVISLLALQDQEQDQEEDQDGGDEHIDIDTFDNSVIDPELRSTTQIGIARIGQSSDTYLPGTLPLRLYQTNPFSMGKGDDETGATMHQLTTIDIAPTAEELQAIAEEEDDERALSQEIDTLITTTRVGRIAKASEKVISNRRQALQEAKGGRGGRRGRRGRGGRA
jgi:hypothetical protein